MTRLHALLLAVFLMAGSIPPALAQDSLDAAKAAGVVGERPDGLVAIVRGGTGDLKALVDRVNSQRMKRYQEIAKANGTSLQQVQAVAGKQLIEKTPSGQYVLTPGGGWVRK